MLTKEHRTSPENRRGEIPFARALTLFLVAVIALYGLAACLIVLFGAHWAVEHCMIIGALVLLSIAAIFGAVAVGRMLFSTPLNELRERVTELSVNPTAARQISASRIREIQLLAGDVASLAERAYLREQALHEAYADMEQRVASRTEELRNEVAERRNADRELEHSLSLLRATFDATVDGILAVDTTGGVISYNARFASLWHLPESIFRARSDELIVSHMVDHVANPEAFLARLRTLNASTESVGCDTIELQDGRVLERYSQPQWVGDTIVGRVWSYRDITEGKRTEDALRYNNLLLNIFNQAQSQFIANAGIHVLFDSLLGDILDLAESDYGFIAEVCVDADGQPYARAEGYLELGWVDDADTAPEGTVRKPFEVRDLDSVAGQAIRTQKPVIAAADQLGQGQSGLPRSHPVLSALLAIPLLSEDGVIGLLVVGSRVGDYGEDELRRLEPLGSFCANLLDAQTNTRRRREAEAALRANESRLRAIVDTAVEGIVTVDEDGTVDLVNRAAADLFGYTKAELRNGSVDRLVPESFRPDPPNFLHAFFRQGDRRRPGRGRQLRGLRKNGETFPMELAVSRFQMGPKAMFTGILRDITERVAVESQLHYRADFENVIASLSTEFINLPLNAMDRGINHALRAIGEFVGADRSYLFQFDADGHTMRYTHEWERPGVVRKGPRIPQFNRSDYHWSLGILSRFQPFCVNRVADLPAEAAAERELYVSQGIQSVAAAPMISEGRVIGVLGFVSIRNQIDWPQDTVTLLRLVGEICANAIERKRTEEALAQAREQEVENAARVQRMLLISAAPTNLPEFDIAAVTVPSQRVDGDFYDFFVHSERVLDVVIGDVMGKGMEAALLGAATKAHVIQAVNRLHEAAQSAVPPETASIVNQLHLEMAPQLISLETFVTLCMARFDLNCKQVRIVDAGHTKTLHLPGKDGPWRPLEGRNLPLGVNESESYHEEAFDFAEGDTFVFFSDGVTEARDPRGRFYGHDRLVELLEINRNRSSADLAACITDDVTRFTGRAELSDDLTVVVVRVCALSDATVPGTASLELTGGVSEVPRLRGFLKRFLTTLPGGPISTDLAETVELATVEAATNCMRHAYADGEDGPVRVTLSAYPDRLEVAVRDWGKEFTPGVIGLPTSDDRSGGLGLYIMYKSMDTVKYLHNDDGSNCVLLAKHLKEN